MFIKRTFFEKFSKHAAKFLVLLLLTGTIQDSTYGLECGPQFANLRQKVTEPFKVVRTGLVSPQAPEVTWLNSFLKFWYYTPNVPFSQRKIVAEIFNKARRSGAHNLSDAKLLDDEIEIIKKFNLEGPLNSFLTDSRKIFSPYTAGYLTDLVKRITLGTLLRIPGVPSKDKVIANWIYNKSLMSKLGGHDVKLSDWELKFLADRKLTEHFDKFLKQVSDRPVTTSVIRSAQTSGQFLVPVIGAGLWVVQNQVEKNETDCPVSDLFDANKECSISNKKLKNYTSELIILSDGEKTENFGIKIHNAVYFSDVGFISTVPIKQLQENEFYVGAKTLTRIRINMKSDELEGLKADLQKLSRSMEQLKTPDGKILPSGMACMYLISQRLGNPWMLNPGFSGEADFVKDSAKLANYLSEDDPSAPIAEIFVTKLK